MPSPNEKVKPGITNPSPSFLQRFFGSSPMSPEMLQGIDIARKENPNLAPVQTYGPLSKIIGSSAMAYASPGRSIYMNPDAMQGQSPQEVADTLTHEQTHVNQMNEQGYGPTRTLINQILEGGKYHQRPDEMGAYQAEKQRRALMGRPQSPVPSFTSGNFNIPMDTNLPIKGSVLDTGPSAQSPLEKWYAKNPKSAQMLNEFWHNEGIRNENRKAGKSADYRRDIYLK